MTSYYPGSKRQAKVYGDDYEELPPTETTTLSNPRKMWLAGKETSFYTIGELAGLLNRKPVTVRKWEADGIIPKATFIAPSGDKRGKRRLYTEEQILGLVNIAREEGILETNAFGHWKPVTKTAFREKAIQLFKELSETYTK